MDALTLDGSVFELSASEAEDISGGGVPVALQVATFFVAAFRAGFLFGYNHVGPALF